MSNLQIIEKLCCLVEDEANLIAKLAARIDEIDALTAEEKDAIKRLRENYTSVIGSEESTSDLLGV